MYASRWNEKTKTSHGLLWTIDWKLINSVEKCSRDALNIANQLSIPCVLILRKVLVVLSRWARDKRFETEDIAVSMETWASKQFYNTKLFL